MTDFRDNIREGIDAGRNVGLGFVDAAQALGGVGEFFILEAEAGDVCEPLIVEIHGAVVDGEIIADDIVGERDAVPVEDLAAGGFDFLVVMEEVAHFRMGRGRFDKLEAGEAKTERGEAEDEEDEENDEAAIQHENWAGERGRSEYYRRDWRRSIANDSMEPEA